MEKDKIKIAGIVIFYKSTLDIIDNINSYINDLDILYAIDNSDKKEIKLIDILKTKEKITLIIVEIKGLLTLSMLAHKKPLKMDMIGYSQWMRTAKQLQI